MAWQELKQKLDVDVIRLMYVGQQLGTPCIAKNLLCSSNTIWRFLKWKEGSFEQFFKEVINL